MPKIGSHTVSPWVCGQTDLRTSAVPFCSLFLSENYMCFCFSFFVPDNVSAECRTEFYVIASDTQKCRCDVNVSMRAKLTSWYRIVVSECDWAKWMMFSQWIVWKWRFCQSARRRRWIVQFVRCHSPVPPMEGKNGCWDFSIRQKLLKFQSWMLLVCWQKKADKTRRIESVSIEKK